MFASDIFGGGVMPVKINNIITWWVKDLTIDCSRKLVAKQRNDITKTKKQNVIRLDSLRKMLLKTKQRKPKQIQAFFFFCSFQSLQTIDRIFV